MPAKLGGKKPKHTGNESDRRDQQYCKLKIGCCEVEDCNDCRIYAPEPRNQCNSAFNVTKNRPTKKEAKWDTNNPLKKKEPAGQEIIHYFFHFSMLLIE